MTASRAPDRPRRAIVPDKVAAPGVVTRDRAESFDKQRRYLRMRMALEQITKLDMFEDAADAARAAVAIAKEALK